MEAGASLVELDLSDNALGPNGMEGIVDFLKSSSCFSLQELRLNNNGLGPEGGTVGGCFCLISGRIYVLLEVLYKFVDGMQYDTPEHY